MPFVSIHVLREYCCALPNRDRQGLAKRAFYGDAERQRISSQCLKAALRRELVGEASRFGLGMAHRSTVIIPRVVVPALIACGMATDTAAAYGRAVAQLFVSEDATVGEDGSHSQPIVLGQHEARGLVELVQVLADAGIAPASVRAVCDKPRSAPEPVKAAIAAVQAMSPGLDALLFGRMATGCIVDTTDGCAEVAHAITVHPTMSTVDFFTTQDTLREEPGAAHMNTMELTSGLFYLHALLDVDRLRRIAPTLTIADVRGLVAWMVWALALTDPAAKRGSTAPTMPPCEVMVEVMDRLPLSYAGAYEVSIRPRAGQSLVAEAIGRLNRAAADADDLIGDPALRVRLADFRGRGGAVAALADAVAGAV